MPIFLPASSISHRHLLDDRDDDLVGIDLANSGRLHGAQPFEPRLRLLGIKGQGRVARPHRQQGDDILVGGQRLAADLDGVDAETGLGELTLHEAIGGQAGRADRVARLVDAERQQQRQDRAEAAQDDLLVQHPDMAGLDQGAAAGTWKWNGEMTRIDRLGVGETLGPYLLQLASSTIQATSSSNEWPAWRACSGTSDVSVMPGWVLISRQTSSPSGPAWSL